jgi:hypothetical protein
VLRAAHALHDPGCCRLLDEAESLGGADRHTHQTILLHACL